ncbi:MAG: secondary thiamine-phosphate synthase enzyme YjbQ [Patescibacteria group bacterium]
MFSFSIKTQKDKEVVDLTENINEYCLKKGRITGSCLLSSLHTTTALSIADLDPGTDMDMLDAFEKLIPDLDFRHPHNPPHVPDHILSAIIGTSVSMPVEKGELSLGTWQRVVFFEFNGPKERSFKLSLFSENS